MPTTFKTASKALAAIVATLDAFMIEHDGALCAGTIAKARELLHDAERGNAHEENAETENACGFCDDRGWLRINSGLHGSEIQACTCAAGKACGSDGDARNAYKAWLVAVKPESMICDESIRTPCSEAGADPCRCHCHMCTAYRAKLAAPPALRVFANPHFLERSYEHTNIVAVEATQAPANNWTEADRSKLDGLTKLWTQAGVTYWGHL